MHTTDLSWFVTVAELESVTRAAELLGLSQPTLSRSLQRVESDFGARLFERGHRALTLNDDGRTVLSAARAATAQLDDAREHISAARDPESGTVRLTFLYSLGTSLVPQLIRSFRAEAPAIRFGLRHESSLTVLEDLATGRAELGITGPRPAGPGLGWHLLQQQRLRLAVPPGHRLARRRRVSLAEAAQEDFVMVQQGLEFRSLVDDLCRSTGFTPRVAFESSDLATIESFVGAGLGVAVLPEQHGAGGGPSAHSARLGDRGAAREIGLVWDATASRSPAAERFRRFLVDGRGPVRPDSD